MDETIPPMPDEPCPLCGRETEQVPECPWRSIAALVAGGVLVVMTGMMIAAGLVG